MRVSRPKTRRLPCAGFGRLRVFTQNVISNRKVNKEKTKMSRIFLATITCGVLISIPGLAQEDYTKYKSDATVQGIGSFVKSTTDNGTKESATKSGGVLGTYRYYFNRHSGVEVNYGYTSNTEKYNGNGVKTNSHEV
jgi:hypothetical protein